MRTESTTYHGAISNVLLPGAILLANIDVTGLLEYALKAAAGGAIWLAYKMAADKLERRKNARDSQSRNRAKKAPIKSGNNGLH